jgi:ubiquitin carboxyl-terminal hydrolase L3
MRQTVGNACGIIAAVHALAAAAPHLPPAGGPSAAASSAAGPFTPGSYLDTFLPAAAPLPTPAARGALLEDPPPGAPAIAGEAAAAGAAGQSAAPPPEAEVDLHYAALVPALVADEGGEEGWRLVELDGRKEAPVDHGPLAAGPLDSLLADAAAVARAAMAAGGEESIQFNLMALVGGPPEGEGEGEG